MKKTIFTNTLLAAILFTTALKAQKNDAPFLEINGKTYSADEFDYIYEKNNSVSSDPVSKKEYVDLFVNYKLKVTDAEAMGLDTMPDFKKELSYYRNELAKPYLSDKRAIEEMAKEAYDRMLEDVDVSHILIRLPRNAFPEDTLKAYEKINNIREKIINGADFEQMAVEYSEDPSAKRNKGRLGFISVFQTVYPFETAAYTTPLGEISPIIRTSFGYHIVKVNGKRRSPGEIKVAHIMKIIPRNASPEIQQKAKNEIDSVYQLLLDGEDFKALAKKYSDDRNTAGKGGELEWFGTGRMIPEFAEAAFAIPKNGEFSKPIRSRAGWHIIYRIDKRDIGSYEDNKDKITQRISKSDRMLSGKKATIKRLKEENDFKIDSSTVTFLTKSFTTKNISVDDFYKMIEEYKEPLCYFADTTLYLSGFSKYLRSKHGLKPGTSPLVLESKLNDFYGDELLKYEKAHLEEKYPEFRYLVNEYHDGLLIFDISQKKIWDKASSDSTGLMRFYEENKEKYYTPEQFKGDIFFCKNKKTVKGIKKVVKDSITQETINMLKNKFGDTFIYKSGTFTKGKDDLTDAALWNMKQNKKTEYPQGFTKIYHFGEFIPAKAQKIDDVKGLVIADYQNYLEKEWIKQLKEKYKPKLNLKALHN